MDRRKPTPAYRLKVARLKMEPVPGQIIGYTLQVWQPSFADIDRLKADGWSPNPPASMESWNLKNTVMFWTAVHGFRESLLAKLPRRIH